MAPSYVSNPVFVVRLPVHPVLECVILVVPSAALLVPSSAPAFSVSLVLLCVLPGVHNVVSFTHVTSLVQCLVFVFLEPLWFGLCPFCQVSNPSSVYLIYSISPAMPCPFCGPICPIQVMVSPMPRLHALGGCLSQPILFYFWYDQNRWLLILQNLPAFFSAMFCS